MGKERKKIQTAYAVFPHFQRHQPRRIAFCSPVPNGNREQPPWPPGAGAVAAAAAAASPAVTPKICSHRKTQLDSFCGEGRADCAAGCMDTVKIGPFHCVCACVCVFPPLLAPALLNELETLHLVNFPTTIDERTQLQAVKKKQQHHML